MRSVHTYAGVINYSLLSGPYVDQSRIYRGRVWNKCDSARSELSVVVQQSSRADLLWLVHLPHEPRHE